VHSSCGIAHRFHDHHAFPRAMDSAAQHPWGPISGDFERSLAAQAGSAVMKPRVDGEARRGRDHVRVTVAMTVASADVAGALTEAWQAFREAARDDPRGWDLASAAAEVRPEGNDTTSSRPARSVSGPAESRRQRQVSITVERPSARSGLRSWTYLLVTMSRQAVSQGCSRKVQQPDRPALTSESRHRPVACTNDRQ
jgi:hypothetical protein